MRRTEREGEDRERETIYFVLWVSTTKEGVNLGPVRVEDVEEEAELDILSLHVVGGYNIRPGLKGNEHCCITLQVVMIFGVITKDGRIQDRGAVRVGDIDR